jgi:hypothetical protein
MTSGSNKEKIATKIAGGIIKVQTRFSERVNRLKNLKGILIVFCFISGSLSVYYLVTALTTKPKARIHIDRIRAPRPIEDPAEDIYSEKIPDVIYYSIQEYKRYMDSTGEQIRPGLADSMRVIEEMYLQQQK